MLCERRGHVSEQQQCVRQMDVVVLLIQHTALLIWARPCETNHPSVFQHYHIDQSRYRDAQLVLIYLRRSDPIRLSPMVSDKSMKHQTYDSQHHAEPSEQTRTKQ